MSAIHNTPQSHPFQSWAEACHANDPSEPPNESSITDSVALRLHQEARSHFELLSNSIENPSEGSSSLSSTVAQDLSKASYSAPNGALASLVSVLRPAISGSSGSRAVVRGLSCLEGALEGCASLTQGVRQAVGLYVVELCRLDDDAGMAVENESLFVEANDDLSPEEVTARLNEIEQRQQRTNGSKSTTSREEVRDSAVACLRALVRSGLDFFPTQQSAKNKVHGDTSQSQSMKEAMCVLYESMELRIQLAMKGLRYRCQNELDSIDDADKMTNAGDGYGGSIDADFGIEDHLSQLPRAKRSLCFSLLDGALDGLNQDVTRGNTLQSDAPSKGLVVSSSVKQTMARLAFLSSSCLHGETDPRCLLQLLRLLNKVQRIMCPLFHTNKTTPGKIDVSIDFPSTQIFDAVAPYYPVHFTPPKNDPHKITQGMLHKALMGVLCEEGVVLPESLTVNEGEENMIVHAARMFMERLEPQKSTDYQPPSSGIESEEEDKLGALRDLSTLFLSPWECNNTSSESLGSESCRTENSQMQQKISLNVRGVSPSVLSELSSTLARVHEEATIDNSKSLGSSIRQFSSSFGYSLESNAVFAGGKCDHKTSLWEAFVVDCINRLSSALDSPQGMRGRASTAYMASLAAGGGMRTLNKVLETCIPRYLAVLSLSGNANSSNDKTTSATRGIAAMMSSCQVAMDRWERDTNGVRMHPHPLVPYVSSVIAKIVGVFDAGIRSGDEMLSSAAIAALESFLTCAEFSLMNADEIAALAKMYAKMADSILVKEQARDFTDEWKINCARTLGVLIATCRSQKNANDNTTESCGALMELADKTYHQAMDSAVVPLDSSDSSTRSYDWIVLATACSVEQVARSVVADLLSEAVVALRSACSDCPPLMAFSFISRHGGPHVTKVFHTMAHPSTTPIDLINALKQPLDDKHSPSKGSAAKGQFNVGMNHLKLPATITDEQMKCDQVIERAYSILPHLLPAFESSSAGLSFCSIVEMIEQVLPPLSRWDEAQLCVTFPILATILSHSKATREKIKDVPPMTRQLAEFIINPDHGCRVRSAASSCMFSLALHFEGENERILDDIIGGSLLDSLRRLQSNPHNPSAFSKFQDIFNFLSLWGSTTACKVGINSKGADEIAMFFVKMACVGSASFPFSTTLIELKSQCNDGSKYSATNNSSYLSVPPAFAYGSMLSVYNGSPFWRQRVVYKTVPVVVKALQNEAQSQTPPALGLLSVVATLCCLHVTLISEANVEQMAPTLVAGLVHLSKDLEALTRQDRLPSYTSDVLGLILAAIDKLYELAPQCLARFTGVITSSLLLLCAHTAYNDIFFSKHILALQCLESVTKVPSSRNAKLRERDQVVTVLSKVVDHPSAIVRQAVVHVRNVWYSL